MTGSVYFQLTLLLAVLWLLTKPLGWYIAQIMEGKPAVLNRIGQPLEHMIYRLSGVHADKEMNWKQYAIALIVFNTLGALFVYLMQRIQGALPLNPQAFGAVGPDSSFNTAVSFATNTNTNWQGYVGEVTMSYLTDIVALGGQHFFSVTTAIAVVVALIRGFARQNSVTVGNFWVDTTRAALYILLPMSFVIALVFMSQGMIQNFDAYKEVETLAGAKQTIAMGPVASWEAIKILGTNGGGIFNANSAHPFENPTPFTNWLQMLLRLLLPASLCYTFGRMVSDTRQGWAILAAMTLVFAVAAVMAATAEQQGNPVLTALGVDQTAHALQAGGNMEGKETRYGIVASAIFSTIVTVTSCGAVNAMHDSFTPLGGMIPLWMIQLSEVIFGGVGSGLYGMLVFAMIAVFLAGLMIGRTPEFLGKKIEAYDMKLNMLATLIPIALVLIGTAIAISVEAGKASIYNPGGHGFSEVLYAFSSAAHNNGSAFAGISANTLFYNTMLGIAIWFGRYGVIVSVLAVAGSMAAKKRLSTTEGTLPTHDMAFVFWLIAVVIIVGSLTYLPALALGPIAEHFMLPVN